MEIRGDKRWDSKFEHSCYFRGDLLGDCTEDQIEEFLINEINEATKRLLKRQLNIHEGGEYRVGVYLVRE